VHSVFVPRFALAEHYSDALHAAEALEPGIETPVHFPLPVPGAADVLFVLPPSAPLHH
jgi:hypothetical protein